MPRNRYGQETGEPVENWAPREAPGRLAVAGRYCRLEPLDASRHADDLHAAFAEAPDGRDWTYLPVERPETRDACRAHVAAQAASDDPLHYAILDLDGRAVGTAALMRVDRANGVIEIGHILYGPRLRRTAAGTEAIALLLRRVFDELGYRRFEWKCDALNAPSRRAAHRYGFGFEGVFRQAIVTKGRNRDTAWYAMTDRDWKEVRGAYARWLDPANFDAAQRQLRSLAACRAAEAEAGEAGADRPSASR